MSASALVCLAPGSEETEAVTTIDIMVRGGIQSPPPASPAMATAITCSRGVKPRGCATGTGGRRGL